MIRTIALSLMLSSLSCGGNLGERGDELECFPTADAPYSVTVAQLPLADFVLDAGRVCFASDGYPRTDTCGAPGIYWRRGSSCPDYTYCPSPYQQVEYRLDPLLGAQRLFCRP